MFKNAIVYRLNQSWIPDLKAVEYGLSNNRFVPCGPTQSRSSGFIEPRGEPHGPLVESIDGQWIITLCVENKKVPGAVVQQHLLERLKAMEANTGRKPGRNESKEIKEEIILDLLPKAFPQQHVVRAWIDHRERMLVVDASAQGKADLMMTELVKAIDSFGGALVQTQESPAVCMAHWLRTQENPNGFSVDRECELKATDESKSVVRYGRHALDIEEVKQHVLHGKIPTRLALTWSDHVSFVLSDSLQIKKISLVETESDEGGKGQDSGFDADVAILTGQLKLLLPDLYEALGGEVIANEESPVEEAAMA